MWHSFWALFTFVIMSQGVWGVVVGVLMGFTGTPPCPITTMWEINPNSCSVKVYISLSSLFFNMRFACLCCSFLTNCLTKNEILILRILITYSWGLDFSLDLHYYYQQQNLFPKQNSTSWCNIKRIQVVMLGDSTNVKAHRNESTHSGGGNGATLYIDRLQLVFRVDFSTCITCTFLVKGYILAVGNHFSCVYGGRTECRNKW